MEIAYYSHDLDDSLVSGLLSEEAVERVRVWSQTGAPSSKRAATPAAPPLLYHPLPHRPPDLGRRQTTEEKIRQSRVQSADDVRSEPKPSFNTRPAAG